MLKPTVQQIADMYTVRTRGKESIITVLIVDSKATADPTPSTDIITKKSTENNWKENFNCNKVCLEV